MIQHFTTPDGVKLAYRDEGEGIPILCLSGLTRSGTDFDYIAPYLADARLIRLDYRGRGQSDWADPSTYAIPTEAKDVLCLLDHLKLPKAAIIGTSRGGMIAMYLAAHAKSRLSGVCLVDIGPKLEHAGLAFIKSYIGKNPSVSSYEKLAIARARFAKGFDNVPQSRWLEDVQKHFTLSTDGLRINYDPQLATVFDRKPDAANAIPADIWPWFKTLQGLPLALIRGANSDILSLETAQKMQALRPDMIFADVPDRGHVPFLDEDESIDALRRWIGELE